MEHAREANLDDLGVVAVLWQAAVDDLDGHRGGELLAGAVFHADVEAHLRSSIEAPDSVVVVGFIDEVAVGFARAGSDDTRRELVGVIELIYVDPPARGVSVGEAMLNVVLSWCESRGCIGVDAPALPGSRPAKAFFEDQGFQARLLVMHHSLPRSPEPE